MMYNLVLKKKEFSLFLDFLQENKKLENHYAINYGTIINMLYIDCSENKFAELQNYLRK